MINWKHYVILQYCHSSIHLTIVLLNKLIYAVTHIYSAMVQTMRSNPVYFRWSARWSWTRTPLTSMLHFSYWNIAGSHAAENIDGSPRIFCGHSMSRYLWDTVKLVQNTEGSVGVHSINVVLIGGNACISIFCTQ